MLTDILPSWVEPDPLRSRAIDPLGLQVISDRLADRLLPGLSVQTTRARYFSFLCWARDKAGTTADEREIHRLEVALTFLEARLSLTDPTHTECRFVGKIGIAPYLKDNPGTDVIPHDPRIIYKVPVWRAYRASMVHLGLLERSPRYYLTDTGQEVASAFRKAIGVRSTRLSDKACLSRIRESRREQQLLRDAIGLSLRGKLDSDWASSNGRSRRAALGRLLRRFSSDGMNLNPGVVLSYFEKSQATPTDEPQNTLRAAAIWEYLSLGLNLIFVAWVRATDCSDFPAFLNALRASVRSRRIGASLSDVDMQDNDFQSSTQKAIACLYHAVALFDRLSPEASCLLDAKRFDLARNVLSPRLPANGRADELLHELIRLHQYAKGDETWFQVPDYDRLDHFCLNRDRKKSWQPPKRVAMHGYRMPQFGQIAYDLGGY